MDKAESQGRKKSMRKDKQDGGAQGSKKVMSSQKSDNFTMFSSQVNISQLDLDEEDKSVPDVLKCESCQESFSDENDQLIECDRCELWFCLSCTGMDPKHYELLNDKTLAKNFLWMCGNCKAPALKAVKTDKDIETRCNEFLGKFRVEVKEELKVVKEDIADLKATSESHKVDLQSMKKDVLEEAIREVQERQKRNLNLIFYNVEESDEEDPQERKKEDLRILNGVLRQIGINANLMNPTRLGKSEEASRPLRVRTTCNEDMTRILGAGRKLMGIESLKHIFINKDRTPLERVEWKRLMELRKEKNDAAKASGLEENWIIRNHQVVQGRPKDK